VSRRRFIRGLVRTAAGLLVPAAAARAGLVTISSGGGGSSEVGGGGDGTPLAQAFEALSAGDDADYPGGAMAEALASTDWNGGSQGVCDWNMLFHHDSLHSVLHAFGKSADSQGRHYAHIVFDEASETWAQVGLTDFLDPGGIEDDRPLGHPYCERTLDTTTGDYYWRAWEGSQMRRFTYGTQDWDYVLDDVNADGSAWIGSNPGAIAFVPELYTAKTDKRGIFIWGRGRAHTISIEDETDDQLALGSDVNDPGAAIWAPGDNWAFGTGGDGNVTCWRVAPGNPPTYAQITNVPVHCGASGEMSILIPHPVSGIAMILERDFADPGADRVWFYNKGANTWDLQAFAHPFADLAAANGNPGGSPAGVHQQWIASSMPEYEGIGCLWMNGTGAEQDYNLSFHVWKPDA
jgi:hypothetical protein